MPAVQHDGPEKPHAVSKTEEPEFDKGKPDSHKLNGKELRLFAAYLALQQPDRQFAVNIKIMGSGIR